MLKQRDIPKLSTRQEVYDYVCRYVEKVAKFYTPEVSYSGVDYYAFCDSNGMRSTLGCLFHSEQLNNDHNTQGLSFTNKKRVYDELRKVHGLHPKQDVDDFFLRDLEQIGELLNTKTSSNQMHISGKKAFISEMKDFAIEYDLTPFKFKKQNN